MTKVNHIDTCPYCGSHNVTDRINEIQCLDCGSLDGSLYDYPNAYDMGGISEMEQSPQPLYIDVDSSPLATKQLQNLKGQLVYLQNKINEHLDKKVPSTVPIIYSTIKEETDESE